MRETIMVDEGVYAKGEAVFRAAADVHCVQAPAAEAALAAAVTEHGARAVIVGTKPYTGPLYEALAKKSGALIARFGVGHDSINKDLARRHGIIVTNTPGVLDVSVAEHTIGLLCCLARHIAATHTEMRAGKFAPQTGMELHGKTLGILGFGNIGRRVAAIAHFGLGMNVITHVRGPKDSLAEKLAANGITRYTTTVEELFRESDVISIHLAANAGTQQFVNATRLAWLKPTALLINTARGAVLDEVALFDALAAGRFAGAALDVFEREPYVPAQPGKDLRTLANVVLTPHIGSNTREANTRMAAGALANVRHFLAGRLDQLNRVDGG